MIDSLEVLSLPGATMDDVARAHADAPLIGRTEQLQALLAAVDAAADRQPSAVLLTGDAGVGKTRLVTELARRAVDAGARVLLGHCLDLGDGGIGYLPFAEALAPLAGRDDTSPALSRWLGDGGARLGGDEEVGQLQLFDAVLSALDAGEATTVLVLEDLHWADRSSRDLLAFLVRRLSGQRLLVVATVRTDDLHRRHPLRPMLAELGRLPVVERLELAGFTAEEMTDYVAAVTGSAPDPVTVADLLGRSEGNPYFAEQLLECAAGAGGAALPGALADLLLSRVDALSENARHVLRASAVAGRRVDHEVLTALVGLPPEAVEEALREAVARYVLVPSGDGYVFRHALAREAVYGDLLPGERVRWHAAFARLLTERGGAPGRGGAAMLAHHLMASHDVPGALRASVRAGEEALEALAPAEALQHLERALQLWDAVPDARAVTGRGPVELTLAAATAATRAGSPARAVALSADAVQRADRDGTAAERVHTRRLLATSHMGTDVVGEELRVADEALELAAAAGPDAGIDPADVAWATAIAARSLAHFDYDEEAVVRLDRAQQLAEEAHLADVQADVLTTRAGLRNMAGDVAGATRYLEQALATARRSGSLRVELRVAFNLAVTAYESGNVREALTDIDAALARAAETGLSWSDYGLELRVLQLIARFAAADLAGSRRLAEVAGDRPAEPALARVSAVALLAAVARGDDDAAAAVARLDAAWQHDGQIAMVAGGAGAELQIWEGDPAGALHTVNRAIDHVSRVWERWFMGGIWLSAVGLAAAAELAEHGRLVSDRAAEQSARDAGARLLHRAEQTAELGRPRTGRMGPEGVAWLARAHAEWSRVTGAPDPELWRQAVEAFAAATRGFDGYERARSRMRLAEALLATGDRAEAAEQAALAAATAETIGARPLHRAIAALVARGRLDVLDARLPRARTTPASALTARELQVLGLLAEGLTNREAGRRLFVSEKTVSVHVSNLLAKLGARSRTEAVTVAHQRGLLRDAVAAAAVSPPDARR